MPEVDAAPPTAEPAPASEAELVPEPTTDAPALEEDATMATEDAPEASTDAPAPAAAAEVAIQAAEPAAASKAATPAELPTTPEATAPATAAPSAIAAPATPKAAATAAAAGEVAEPTEADGKPKDFSVKREQYGGDEWEIMTVDQAWKPHPLLRVCPLWQCKMFRSVAVACWTWDLARKAFWLTQPECSVRDVAPSAHAPGMPVSPLISGNWERLL
jgi:hypothetical protein